MRVLMLSTDQKILEQGSDAHARMLEYAQAFGDLHIFLINKFNARFMIQESRISPKFIITEVSFFIAMSTFLPTRLNLVGIDVVTAQDPFEIGFIGWRIAKKLGVKLQLQIHTDFLSPYFTKFSVLNAIRVLLAKFLLPKADSIRVVSKRMVDSLKTINFKLKTDPVVLPVFVDVEKIKNSEIKTDLHKKYPQFEKIVLMISRITKEKNIELAIEAMQEVTRRNPKAGLVIVGEGPELENLKLLSSNFHLQSSVQFESWTNDVASYYKTADMFLNTSWYEGYGMTLIEAAACGLSIVSTDVGIAREVNAVIVGWSSGEVGRAITEALENLQEPNMPNLPSKQEYLEMYASSLTN